MRIVNAVGSHPGIGGGAGNPTHGELFVGTPIICAAGQARVVNRPPMLAAVSLRGFEVLFEIPLSGPELTDHKAIGPGLNQIDTDLIRVYMPAQLSNRLVGDLMAAAWAEARLVVARLVAQRHILFAVGAIACSGSTPLILVEDEILRDTNLIHPTIPILWDCLVSQLIRTKILRREFGIGIGYPCARIHGHIVGPLQAVQLGISPHFIDAVIGDETPGIAINKYLIGGKPSPSPQIIRVIECRFQDASLNAAAQIKLIFAAGTLTRSPICIKHYFLGNIPLCILYHFGSSF